MPLASVLGKIDAARTAAKREDPVTLVAVSKFQPVEKIRDAIAQGQRVFGENRVQEAAEKFSVLRGECPGLSLHFIGHLQTNKARDAVRLFDVIETVDSEKLARALKEAMDKEQKQVPCLIQVNTGEEAQKGGVIPQDLPALLQACRRIGLGITGLMCIPPEGDLAAPHFALLRKLRDRHGLETLSMGMSADFETAVRFGATHVRVGSAVFGERQQQEGTT